MTQYINKDAVEEILRNLWKEDDGTNPEHRICYNKALQEVQCELDTLETKDVDLDKEIRKTCRGYRATDSYDATISKEGIENIARYFFNLGLKAKGE